MKDGFMKTGGYTTPGKLVGLGGELRAGKDEAADHLVKKHGFVKMGMSDVLNEALQKIGPNGPWVRLSRNVVLADTDRIWRYKGDFIRYGTLLATVGYVAAKEHIDVREYLQGLGTEVGREMIDQDVWVKMAEARIRDHWAQGKDVVITAMRFPNELDMLKRLGGHSVWIARSASKRLESTGDVGTPENGFKAADGGNAGVTAHKSETSVSRDDFSYTIHNEGTLKELYRMVDHVVNSVKPVQSERVEKYRKASTFYRECFAPPYDR